MKDHPADALAKGSQSDIDVLLSTASEEIGWWLRNDLARFDPHTVEAVEDEVAGWRVARSRARAIVAEYNVAGRSPAQVRSAVLTDYIYTLPAARAALAHARAGGSSRLLMIGPTEQPFQGQCARTSLGKENECSN